jgi:diguanylate cyclase (GGDEF)-like protein/PAS domain S-box-containing protein
VSAGSRPYDNPFGEDEAPSSRAIQQRLNDHRQLLARLMRSDALTRGDINEALAQVTELATELLRVERASVWHFDKHRLSIECLDLFDSDRRLHLRGSVIAKEQAPRYFEALARERCLAADDAKRDPRTSQFREWYLEPNRIGALLDAPIFVRGEMVGVVCHEHIGDARHWEFWEELLAGTVADFVALVTEASERLRAEHRLGLYKSHLDELRRMRASEIQKIRYNLELHGEGGQVSAESGALARDVLDSSPIPLLVISMKTAIVRYANPRAAALFDTEPGELGGRDAAEFYVDPLERQAVARELEASGRLENVVVRLKTQTSWPFWALVSAQRLTFEGEECAFVGLSDITAQKIAEGAVRRSEQNIRTMFAAAPVAMCLVRGEDATVVFGNRRCADMFGLGIDELEGQKVPDYYADLADRERILAKISKDGHIDDEAVQLKRRNGEVFWALLSCRAVEFEGSPALLSGISDITPQKRMEEKLRELAMQDELTGLYNRRHFLELAESEIARVRRTGAPLSVAILDIDHFKRVNDYFGHAAGDRVLRDLAGSLRETLRGSDVPARFGGEEFVVLLTDTMLEGAVAVTERLRERVGRSEVQLGHGRVARVTVSAGVAELAQGERLEGLLERADEALYRAKAEGRDRIMSSAPPPTRSSYPPPRKPSSRPPTR